MKKLTLLILLIFIAISCNDMPLDKEVIVFDRLKFIYELKQTIDKNIWETFDNEEYDVPFVYFTDSSSYVVNPTEKFLSIFKTQLVFRDQEIKIYKTKRRIDDVPFHMETGITLGSPTDEFNYHSPFMMCSSFEETHEAIPDVNSTEEWATMIIHEYFHGYQYKHQSYIDYFENEITKIQPDSLQSICLNNYWFKKSIDMENQLLLNAIDEMDNLKIEKLVNEFFRLRETRRKNVLEKYNFNVSKYEKFYETMEGTARYVEFSLYNLFSEGIPNPNILRLDSSFNSFENFRKYNIQQDEWLYKSELTTYYYAIGFNMARLMDKLKLNYKPLLFKKGEITLEEILYDFFNYE